MKPFLSVIIPAYNEERRLAVTLQAVTHFLAGKKWRAEVMVISDGSRDATVAIARAYAEKYPQVRVIEHKKNNGKGYAVQQGMRAATGELRLFMDADNATPIEELEKLLPYSKYPKERAAHHGAGGYDIVIGSLGVAGAKINTREVMLRMIAGKLGNWFIQWMLIPGIHDTQRGFKLFTAEAALSVFPCQKVFRWGFDVDILTAARTQGLRIKEMAVSWSHASGSKITLRAYPEVFFDVCTIWLRQVQSLLRSVSHADFCSRFLPKHGTVLDVGSGRGNFLCAIAQKGFQAHGIEVAPHYIQASNELAAAAHVSMTVVRASGERMPFADRSFDFINCAEVTEHVEDPERLCQEMFRVLKSGGASYISFHNRWGIYDYHYHLPFINWMPRLWAEKILYITGKQKPDGISGRQKLITMHYYTYRTAVQLLAASGFAVTDVRVMKLQQSFGYIIWPILVVYKLVLRRLYFNTFHFLLKKE